MRLFFKAYVLGTIIVLPLLVQSIIDSGSEYLVEHYLQVIYQTDSSSELIGDDLNSAWRVDDIYNSAN